MPETVDLLTFCRVVDLGSMTAAARDLGESKGTVSRRVARLEEQVGTSLLRRDGRRVEPTEEGRLYREKAGVALDVLDDAREALRAVQDAPSGLLRITAPFGVGSTVLRPVLPPFLDAYPDIRVELLLTDEVLSFREHRVDVAFRLAEALPDSALIAHRLMGLAPVLVASPGYLERRGAPAAPADLAAHDVLTVPVPAGQRLRFEPTDGGAAVEVPVPGRVLSHDMLLLRDLVLAGAGISLVLSHVAEPDLAAGRLVRVLPGWTLVSAVRLYLLHAAGVLPPKVRAFRDHVRATLDCAERA